MNEEFDYEQYEKDCQQIRKDNEALLEGFQAWLQAKGLSQKTVSKHSSNLDFYLNDFLLRESAVPASEGLEYSFVADYLGYFLIRKCLWSVPSTIKENGASLKKFYEYMAEQGKVPRSALIALKQDIKESMPEWTEDCRLYNNPDYDYFDAFD